MDYIVVTGFPDESIGAAWNECLNDSEYASHFTSPDFFLDPHPIGAATFAVLATQESQVHGVVTGFVRDGVITCGHQGSPHVCVRRGAHTSAVVRALVSGLRHHARRGVGLINVFCWGKLDGFTDSAFWVKQFSAPLGTILLDLSKGSEALFREFSETRRNKIRRAIRGKVDVQVMNVATDFDDYYSIYDDWCRFKGIQPQSYAVHRADFESARGRLIFVARHEGRIIGVSTFRYRTPGIVEYAANVSRRSETKWRQNDLLIWRAIEWSASQEGIRWFSTAGAHFFLQKLGGELHATYRYSLDQSFLRRHRIAEAVREFAFWLYRSLPAGLRNWIRQHVQENDDAGQ